MQVMQNSEQGAKAKSAEEVPLLRVLSRVEDFIVVAYAISLPISLTLSWALFIAGLIIWLARCLVGLSNGVCEKQSLPVLFLPMMLFALAVTISGAFNSGNGAGRLGPNWLKESWDSLYSLKNILPYFWASQVFARNRALAKSALAPLLWISAVSGIYAAFQQVFDFHPGTFKYLQGTGFLGKPMAFAGQMQLFSLLALGLLLSGGYRKFAVLPAVAQLAPLLRLTQRLPVFLGIVCANFVGLFFAGERSAWLGGFVGVLAAAALASWQLILPAFLLMLIAAAFSWFAFPLLQTRIKSLFSGHDVSISARMVIWETCLNKFVPQSPWVGVGWLRFPHFDIPEAIVPGVSKDLNHGHSNYIHILTTTGLIGLLAYLNLLIWIAVVAIKKLFNELRRRDAFEAGLAIGLFAANLALASSGIFEFNFGTAQVRLAQWFLFGLL